MFDTLDSTDVLFTNDCSEFSDTTSTRDKFFTKRLRPLSTPEPNLQFDTDINTISISPSPTAKTDDLTSTTSGHIDIIEDSNMLTDCCEVLFPLILSFRSKAQKKPTGTATGTRHWIPTVMQIFSSTEFLRLNSKFYVTASDSDDAFIASMNGISIFYNLPL